MNGGARRIDGSGLSGISHLVVEVSDGERALNFYKAVLGLDARPLEGWPVAGETAVPLPSKQILVFRAAAANEAEKETGIHQAYRCTAQARAAIAERLAAEGIPVHRYHEDRPAEADDPFYFADPDGNRIQLVSGPGEDGGIAAIDHAAIQASDMEWEEDFFVGQLNFTVDHRVGWNTADYVRARAWAEGKEEMAPGTRRMDHRYRDIPGAEPGRGREVARPNIQIFLDLGEGALGIFLATAHRQEPPPERACGTPRTAIAIDRAAIDGWAETLAGLGVAVEGPVVHDGRSPLAASVYFRDPCGNFFEFCAPAARGI
ncbi:MAG: VOC family protein [Alphaproteobacteria bacterium]|nr:VOC family protein [Alphaproteobacteria bacterium]